MTSWVPEELPLDSDLALAEPPALAAPDGQSLAAVPQFGSPPPAYSPLPRVAKPAIAAKPGLTYRQVVGLLGIVSLLVLVVRVGLYLRDAGVDYSPLYAGAPVEAADASDGLTIVGVNDTVAYRIEPGWVDLFDYFEDTKLAQACNGGAARVGGHITGNPLASDTDAFAMCVVRDEFPRRSLSDTHAELLEAVAETMGGTVAQESGRIATANGLNGYAGVFDMPTEWGTSHNTFVVLGNGSNVVLLVWTTIQPEVDEVALTALLNTIRIDA
jgi:hypothetical protein